MGELGSLKHFVSVRFDKKGGVESSINMKLMNSIFETAAVAIPSSVKCILMIKARAVRGWD